MSEKFYTATYNPDVLSCLANLSNDEVFTPPEIVNQMLDMLPSKLWQDKNATFLDPCCKTGVFLREIAKRLLDGLSDEIPDLQQRVNHIFQKQLFGIAITELTSLLARRSIYCSKYPNSIYSISLFNDTCGKIRFKKIQHRWVGGSCSLCGASISEYNRDESLETYAYEFIHTIHPEEIFDMRFDVIVGNPPYQLSDSGHGMSAKPIYHHFVNQAKKLSPRYLIMIIPSRWFTGGKGLDSFRKEMLSDKHIKNLVDYENFKDVFPGVDLAGGACYFLWDRDTEGPCQVVNFKEKNPSIIIRYLDEFDTFIRQNEALSIVRKVLEEHGNGRYLNEKVSVRKPFGLPTNYQPKTNGIPCWFIQKIGRKFADPVDIDNSRGYLEKWKLLLPKAPIAGQTDFSKPVRFYYDGNTRIAKPGECCTESWIIGGAFDTEKEVVFFKSYLFTKIVRFLLLQTVVSQDVTKKNFSFIPDLEHYTENYSDEMLINKWRLSDEEWSFITSKIADREIGDNPDA